MYASDYNDMLTPQSSTGGTLSWVSRLVSYQGNSVTIRLCPLTSTNNPPSATPDPGPQLSYGTSERPWLARGEWGSYCMNGYTFSDMPSVPKDAAGNPNPSANPVESAMYWKKLANARFVSESVMMMDGLFSATYIKTPPLPCTVQLDLFNGNTDSLSRIGVRHGLTSPQAAPRNVPAGTSNLPGSLNITFLDGHVESPKMKNLNKFYWNATYVGP
jgi:prepilin-type processing-associated H-X9-DG protein